MAETGYAVSGSSRDVLSSKFFLNLTQPIPELPLVDTVYVCAAIASYRNCEGNQSAWVVNADAPVSICRQAINRGMFPIFVSSDSIEFMSIVRPRRFGPDNIASLCHLMIRVGLDRKPGVYRWA